MAFKTGDRVRMKRTDNGGTVTRVMPGNLVQVKLDGGLGHIPMPTEALEPEPFAPPAPKTPAPPKVQPSEVTKATLHEGHGIQLAFDPQLNNEAEPVAYEVYLLNGTDRKIIYDLQVHTGSHQRWSKSGLLDANGKKRLEAVDYRWLNEKLVLTLDVRAVLTDGTGARQLEKVRVKPAQFFAKYVDVPQLYREAHLYTVFREIKGPGPAAPPPPSSSSLRELTRRQLAARPKPQPEKKLTETDVRERLEFGETLDLHLSALVEDPTVVPKHEVLQLQLKRFEEYLDRAIRLGVDSVFIIHGVGNGVLKRAIHRKLHRTKFIRDFRNEYHPKYGFGATEILFD